MILTLISRLWRNKTQLEDIKMPLAQVPLIVIKGNLVIILMVIILKDKEMMGKLAKD